MKMGVIVNGKITGTMLGTEDHGIMTFMLSVDMADNGACGFGGYALDQYDNERKARVGRARGVEAIRAVLECVGISRWESLTGQYVRCELDKPDDRAVRIVRIGNLIKDKWLSLEEFFEK
jgi:hypothetical protein